MSSVNPFDYLDCEDIHPMNTRRPNKTVQKKTPNKSVVRSEMMMLDMVSAFVRCFDIVVCLFHADGRDQFQIFKIFSPKEIPKNLMLQLSGRKDKEITPKVIEEIIKDRRNCPSIVSVWTSYFTKATLQLLLKFNPVKIPAMFQPIFDLLRGDPVDNRDIISVNHAIIIDFRISNSEQEFVYLPDGHPIFFGKTYDDQCIVKRRRELEGILKYIRYALLYRIHFDEVQDAFNDILSLTDDPDYCDFADDAIFFISRFCRLCNPDNTIALRNMLIFSSFEKMKEELTSVEEYQAKLFKLAKELRAKELSDNRNTFTDRDFPSL